MTRRIPQTSGHLPRAHPGEVPLYRVPAETIFQADDFAIPELPRDTAAVSLRLLDEAPDAQGLRGLLAGVRRNPAHVRSFELLHHGQPVVDGVTTTLKGGEWTEPRLRWEGRGQQTIPNALYHGGIQLEDALATLATSQLMDEWGIRGERVQRIDAPTVLASGLEPVPVREVITHMVDGHLPSTLADPDYIFKDTGWRQRLTRYRLKRHLSGADRRPVTMIRTAPTDLRLADVYTDYSTIDKEEIVQAGMDALAAVRPGYDGMRVDNEADVVQYFQEALPYAHGIEHGKLDGHGYHQKFPHPGNILLDAGLVDLDGVMPGNCKRYELQGLVADGCHQALRALGINRVDREAIVDCFRSGSYMGYETCRSD